MNRKEFQNGRLQVTQANVFNLPFNAGTFDLATAFETVYFWPGPLESFKEVRRILQKGGWFLLVNESDGTNRRDDKWAKIISGMKIYTAEQLESFLKETGFSKIITHHVSRKH